MLFYDRKFECVNNRVIFSSSRSHNEYMGMSGDDGIDTYGGDCIACLVLCDSTII